MKYYKPIRLNSLSLEKILKTQQNLSKTPTKIWNDNNASRNQNFDQDELQPLDLNSTILRILESFNGNISEFNQIHNQLIVSGLFQHSLVASRVVKKLCSYPFFIPQAVSLFSQLHEPDAFMCNTIIKSYVKLNDLENAIGFYYEHMVEKCIAPNHYTFPILAKICAELGSIREGEKAHARIVKLGFEFDLFVRNSMIYMYSSFLKIGDAWKVFDACSDLDLVSWNSMIAGYVKNGKVGIARELFDVMPDKDLVSWNSMIAGYVGIEDLKSAQDLFERMLVKDIVSWNTMIDGYARIVNVSTARELFDQMKKHNVVSWNTILALYVRSKNYEECVRLFDRMINSGEVKPNKATLVSVLTACAKLGKLDIGVWIHSYMNVRRIEPDVLLSTALLTMYAKCGSMDLAREIFNEMQMRSVVSWNSMIMGYGMHGHGEKALEMFLEMEKSGETPNGATFVCVLSACVHAGMVLEGWWYFDLMRRVYRIEPKTEHYGCMVDLLGRVGLIKDSEELIQKMPVEVGPALWGALLAACKTHSNYELGKIVGKRLIEMEPKDVGPYVLLSNIYAMEGKWDEVEKVRKMLSKNGLQKAVGSSVVDVSGLSISKSFLEDQHGPNHKKSMVYSLLSELGAQIKSRRDRGRDTVLNSI
ncbi:Pentatricopeptide repeat-containing protein [Thalictrum thalictroides]|uniref:Pentatricopeptide repeat-containing protein n=1 Tax=Thalictrum thalictroides TaxID=46969 RepID=A0A7J6VUW2_THATH|nr:Pentatricopeptide repeat-containing protein [Thalictrum thalictroides]